MAKYLISFPSAAMVVPDGEWGAVGRDAHAVLTARLQWAAILGRPRSMAASPCWNCLRATRPSRGRRVSPRPVGATKNCASSGSTHSPKGDTEMARQVRPNNSFKPKPLRGSA